MGLLKNPFKSHKTKENTGNQSETDSKAGSSNTVQEKPARGKTQPAEAFGLFPLYKPPDGAPCYVDIVAVHGLGGGWKSTWTDETTGSLWLRDFLPAKFPNTRIWSFGYDAAFILSSSVSDIASAAGSLLDYLNGERQSEEEQKRPIIFVAHSLGGIVAKKALILANERSHYYKGIRDSAAGAIFFGVPHRGADLGYWANLATNVLSYTTLGAVGNTRYVKALKKNSPEFAAIAEAFIQPASGFIIIRSFYETEKIGNQLIVDKDSATLRLPNELAVQIAGADHRNVCKFGYAESQKYKIVHNAMTQIFSKLEINDDAFLSRFARSWCAESCVSAFEDSSSTVPQLEQVDFTWISHMVDYRAWSHTFVSGILYVVYDDISGWAINVARELERDIGGSEIGRKLFYYYDPFAFGPGPKKWLGSSGPFSYEADMARSLICQIFAGDSGCISAVDLQQREIQKHPVDYWQDEKRDENGRLIQWKLSLSNPDTAWQHLWSLLACAIRAIKQDVILMLVGLQSHECYVAFRNGLKYLKAAFPNKASNYSDISLPSLSFLVLGEPDSMTVDRPPIKVDFSACIRKTKEILDCLNSLYFRELSARRDLVKSAITGTNDWIWHHPVYERWKGSSSSLLWIYGKAASGKSTLAATLQRLLSINAKELEEGGASYNVADFFYSSRGGPTETSHQFMLRSILYQLLQRDNSLWQCFRETFRARRKACDENIVWSFDDLRQILLNISRSSPNPRSKGRTTRRFLLILDGIDESEERTPGGQRRQKVLSLLTSICSPNYSTIFKIIALSRVEDDLSRVLRTPNHIDMKDVNGPDIEKIISAGIAKLWSHMSQTEDISNQDSDSSSSSGNTIRSIKSAQNHQLINRSAYANYRTKSTGSDYLALSDTSELDFIREYLRAHAHGVILWVILIIRRLVKAVKSQTYTFKQLRTLLSSLPTTLNESYQSMVQKIGDKKDTLDQARYVIAWTLFSKRPLRVKEIRDAIAMFHWQQPTSEQETDFLYMNRVGQLTSSWVPIQTLIWNICGGFIEIVPSDPDAVKCFWKPQPIIGDDYVQLIHESAKEFLFFDEKATFLDLNQNKWDQKISRNLAAYVKMSFSWNYRGEDILRGKGIKSWTTPEFKVWIDLLEDRPLLEYAISQLKGHLDSDAPLETSEEQQIWETVQLCLQGCSNTPETLLYLLLQGWAEKQLQLFRPEFTMNLMPPNLDSESNESSLIDSVSPDPDSGNNRSSLIDPVSPNLDSGNDKSSLTNPVPPSPLSTSSISVSTMAPVMFLKTSLLVGCKLGAVEAVRVLLAAATVAGIEKIYDTDSSGLWGIFPEDTESLGTAPPLCVAVEGGHYLVVRLLLNAGANPAAVNSAGYSALDLAILGRHFSAAQEILRGVESKDMEKLFGHSWGRLKTLRERLKTSRAIFERSDRKVSSSSKYTGTSLQGGKP